MNDESINAQIRDSLTTIDILADHMREILESIYKPPLLIAESFTPSDSRADCEFAGDSYSIEVVNDAHITDWCHTRAELTQVRFCRLVVSSLWIKVGRLGHLSEIPLEDPQLVEKSLKVFHEEVTRYIGTQADLMARTGALCNTVAMVLREETCHDAIRFFDLKYLAHMFSNEYEGWEEIPGIMMVGREDETVDRRSYSKEQIESAISDPGELKWHGLETKGQ